MAAMLKRYETLLTRELDHGVKLVTLNRPETLNSLTFTMFDELYDVAKCLDVDDTVRVIVITGSGRGFCSGLDLGAAAHLRDMELGANLDGQEQWARCITAFHMINTPVIAAVNGPAAGAGFALALAADIRVASRHASFNAAFVRIGLSGGDCGTSYFLPRIVGLGIASELLLTGRIIDAEEAKQIGLVNRIVGDDMLLESALETAKLIAGNSPIGVHLTKQLISTNVDAASLGAALELENRSQVLAARTEDMGEALEAFLDKRRPQFHRR